MLNRLQDDNKIAEKSVEQLLEDVAERTPSPGGGTVASVAGALGASLLHMAASYSIDEEEEGRAVILEELKQCSLDLIDLGDQDREAYEHYREVKRDSSRTEREERDALLWSTRVPVRVNACLKQLIEAYLDLRDDMKSSFQADVKTALELIRVNWRSAHELAMYNLEALPDGVDKKQLENQLNEQEEELSTLFKRVEQFSR